MAGAVISLEQLINASRDVNDLERIMSAAAGVIIETRLGRQCYSMATINALIVKAETDLQTLLLDTDALVVRLDSLIVETNLALDRLNAATDANGFIYANKVKAQDGKTVEQHITGVRPIATGGTGANSAAAARTNLDVYSKAQVEALVATGGGSSVIGIGGGGTGATTAAAARTNLAVYSSSEVDTKFIASTARAATNGVASLDASTKIPILQIPTATANGVASLDANTKIPVAQLPAATETAVGAAEIATQAEVNAATDNARFVTPLKLLAAVKNHLNAVGNAPMYACRVWVNFNGTGTIAIRASGNVSSITDNGSGDYTVNFTISMQDSNYVPSLACTSRPGDAFKLTIDSATEGGNPTLKTASAIRVRYGAIDLSEVDVSIFR